MYGFLDSYTKRKAFKQALDNAFDDGYDPSKAAEVEAAPVSLGKVEEKIDIVDTNKYIKAMPKTAPKAAKSLRKPESAVIDMSKHKDWREKELKKNSKDDFSTGGKGASLFDELFPESKITKNEKAPAGIKTETNSMLDKLYPGGLDKFTDTTKDDLFEDSISYESDPIAFHPVDIPIEEYKNEEPSVPELDSDPAWEELFNKLNLEEIEKEEVQEKATASTFKVETKKPIEKPIEKPFAKPAVKVTEKPKAASAKKPVAAATTAKTQARAKKRKNKVNFDADIIGGW